MKNNLDSQYFTKSTINKLRLLNLEFLLPPKLRKNNIIRLFSKKKEILHTSSNFYQEYFSPNKMINCSSRKSFGKSKPKKRKAFHYSIL